MSEYYVNKNPSSNKNEVHWLGYDNRHEGVLPSEEDRDYIGFHERIEDAVKFAKGGDYPNADPCGHCAKKEIIELLAEFLFRNIPGRSQSS